MERLRKIPVRPDGRFSLSPAQYGCLSRKYRNTGSHPSTPRSNTKFRIREKQLPDWVRHPGKIQNLTPEMAKLLVLNFKGDFLDLSALTTLDAETAKALAEIKGEFRLSLDGLTTLDTETAKALAEYKGEVLRLVDLPTLDTESAKALEKFKGRISY